MDEKTIKVTDKVHVGKFIGSKNGGPVRTWIGVSEYENDACLANEWLTLAEAMKLVKALQKVIKAGTK